MHDIRFIRENPEVFDAALKRRGADPAAKAILELDTRRRAVTTEMQVAQSRRNDASKAIGQAMGQGDKEKAEALKAEVAELKKSLPLLEEQDRELAAELQNVLASLPNMPSPDVPDGDDESGNVELSKWGTPRHFDFTPQEHADIGPALGLDFETGAALSGARFTFLRGQMARLHRALGQFMLDRQTMENGYTECAPPVLVNDPAMYGTDKLPKFAEDSFQTTDGRWLIPTAEVSLTASVQGKILDDDALPMRMSALTLCFRSEAGSAGKDTRGFIRQHQFEKCEMVSVVRPEESDEELERMTACAEGILQALELPYRKLLLCTGDMGFGARKTYDLEVWLPGQGAYREISSCSNTGDFQARRMNTRYRPVQNGPAKDGPAKGANNEKGGSDRKTEFPHTLNGSGLAVGRTLVAVLENYQQADGSVSIPSALRPYMGGIETLTAGQ